MQRSGWTDYGTLDLDVEQFAELIIQECVDTIQDHMSRGKRDDYYRGQSDSIELIKTHFGIHYSPLWHQQSVRYGFGVVEECQRELRANGYDDAAELLNKYFDVWFDKE